MNQTMIAVDTSVSVPLLVARHPDHQQIADWARDLKLYLAGHAAIETYSILTRLPGDLRATADQANQLIDRGFSGVLGLPEPLSAVAYRQIGSKGILGGAVYDALVAMSAVHHSATLATRDVRARPTYLAMGADTLFIG